MALSAGRVGVNPRDVDNQGHVKKGAELKPVEKTAAMTQPVGADTDGKLFTAPSGITFDLLSEFTTFTGDHELSHPITDYKMILIHGRHSSSTHIYDLSAIFAAANMVAGDELLYSSESVLMIIQVKSATILTGISSGLNVEKVYVYGIK